MNPPITLPTKPYEHPAMDYAFLRREGIRHLERLAGQLWTDFNAHDPGITILEQVCYALTDLAHRIEYELPDLLAGAGKDPYDSLPGPAQILTCRPVTLKDLRKLVIDVPGVKNAWLEPVAAPDPALYFHTGDNSLSLQDQAQTSVPIQLQGLYRVLIELADILYVDSVAGEQGTEALKQVTSRLHASRGLAEDYETIKLLDPQDIYVQARIEIEAVDDAEQLLLGIYGRIADYISPPVRSYTLSQLLDTGRRIDEIFDGPVLSHGFIDNAALGQAQRRTTIRTSDLIREIMDVPGVRAVRNIRISKGLGWEDWSLDVDAEKAPKLKLPDLAKERVDLADPGSSSIILQRNGLTAGVDYPGVEATFYRQLRQSTFHSPAFGAADLRPPAGRSRHLENYHSIQHQFPATYGIGSLGLPGSAPPQRQVQAKQLKAYLMFFDQLLANYFSQLAHAGDLFSFSGAEDHTYFSQPITDASLDLDAIRRSELATHRDRLQQITENSESESGATGASSALRRRHRFLNHLLARFAEQFTDYSLILYGTLSAEKQASAKKSVQDKQAFLQDYPWLSSARGTAFDYMQTRSPQNVSGLEQRLRRKLGVTAPDENFYLVEHILLRPLAADQQQNIPILADPRQQDPYSLQLSFVFPDWPARYQDPGFKAFIERTVREETPAHLTFTIHWFDQPAMTEFETIYFDWLDKRRAGWAKHSGA